MATVAQVFEDRKMSMGRVFERAFAAVRANPLVIIGLAISVGAVPTLVLQIVLVQLGFRASPAALTSGEVSPLQFFATVLVSGTCAFAIGAIVQGAMTKATVLAYEGRNASFGESISTGVRLAIPLFGLGLLQVLGLMVGMILLIVPGIILLLMWSVASPALVVEQGGIRSALGRSAALTKGARWKILALLIVVMIVQWLIAKLFGFVRLSQYSVATSTAGLGVGNVVGTLLMATINTTIYGTLWPSLYVELRQWKEGTSADQLAEVFS